jgi:hypothetical protein
MRPITILPNTAFLVVSGCVVGPRKLRGPIDLDVCEVGTQSPGLMSQHYR